VEPRLAARWEDGGTYHYERASDAPRYTVDTPPPTASGFLHLGNVYSYCHPDFIARYRRMRGDNVFYPMGYDDNGLATERLVEKRLGIRAREVGRSTFIERCLEVSAELEEQYGKIWRRLGLSVDWHYSYRTIDHLSRQTSQLSFVDLCHKGRAYRRQAPTIWCPVDHTAIAQAEVNDLQRESEFVTLAFTLDNDEPLPIATTRPELLPACVAVFIHPQDPRAGGLAGHTAIVPLFGQEVPILIDEQVDPEKGTGIVMCCTFGDQQDVEWWYTHHLPLREAIDRDGRLTAIAGPLTGMSIPRAREEVKRLLDEAGLLLARQHVTQAVGVHERCDTPVEYIVTQQWFVRVVDHREEYLEAGEEIRWVPEHMKTRYREWVENVHWDWAISRQRFYGVPIPVWYCAGCGEVLVAAEDELPVDPTETQPDQACSCGSDVWMPEEDVMDTWATSSMSPQIAGRRLTDPELYAEVYPFTLRPQGHDIIRTWAYYTIVKNLENFGSLPWKDIMISGWAVAGEGVAKISKSRGGGPMAPMEMLQRYSADAVRYWAASSGPGRDAIISEEKVAAGGKLVTKLWNVARLAERFIAGYRPPDERPALSTADRWILSRLQRLTASVTRSFDAYDYLAAKNEVEVFFWTDLADNYLEMAKKRLYDSASPGHEGARYTLYTALLTVVQLFAPILPYVTEEIYTELLAPGEGSIHRSAWPRMDEALVDPAAEAAGGLLLDIATTVRRFKSNHSLSLGAELARLEIVPRDGIPKAELEGALDDIMSVTRAREVAICHEVGGDLHALQGQAVTVAVAE
jgi:valyl-tRNA synthetase